MNTFLLLCYKCNFHCKFSGYYIWESFVSKSMYVYISPSLTDWLSWLFNFLKEHRGLLSIRYPMEHGIVKDWNDMERIWQYVYSKDQLQTFSEEVSYLSFFKLQST